MEKRAPQIVSGQVDGRIRGGPALAAVLLVAVAGRAVNLALRHACSGANRCRPGWLKVTQGSNRLRLSRAWCTGGWRRNEPMRLLTGPALELIKVMPSSFTQHLNRREPLSTSIRAASSPQQACRSTGTRLVVFRVAEPALVGSMQNPIRHGRVKVMAIPTVTLCCCAKALSNQHANTNMTILYAHKPLKDTGLWLSRGRPPMNWWVSGGMDGWASID